MALRLLILTIALSFAAPSLLQAQAGNVRGTVVDTEDRPIPGVVITVEGAGAGTTATTDDRGLFVVGSLSPGRYRVRAELSGFGVETREVVIPTTGSVEVALVLRPSYAETIVVTATRSAQTLLSAPATVTVIPAREIEIRAADDFAELLAGTAGLNLARLNARDISFDFRTAGGVLSRSQLVMIDGRSLNQDGLGNVFWDLFPVNFDDVEQVELIGTPGSAVWGANALRGVINVRTKAPRDDPGGTAVVGIGSRGVRESRLKWSQTQGRLSYRLSTSYFHQDAGERDATLPDGSPLPETAAFENQDTTQSKVDLRVDWQRARGKVWTGHVGFADSSGIIHTQTGPNAWADSGSYTVYGGVSYKTEAVEASVYWNRLRGDTVNALYGNAFSATTDAFTGEVVAHRTLGARQALRFGASTNMDHYRLTLAPGDSFRGAVGGFVEDQIAVTPQLTWSVGSRLDKFDTFGATLSPRTSLVYQPTRNQAIRFAFNRAFRAPSLIETFALTDFVNVIPLLPGLPPIVFSTTIAGNRDLQPEVMHAVEGGLTTTLGPRASVSATVYYNSVRDNVRFLQVESYGPADPPPGWFLPPEFVPPLPKRMTFLNIDTVRDRGLELTSNADWGRGISTRASYTFQAETKATRSDPNVPLQLNQAPTHQAFLGMTYAGRPWRGAVDVSYTGSAFWSDVLDARFWGTTPGATLVNGKISRALRGDTVAVSVSATNLFDRRIKQHVFGDILRRQVTAALRFNW